MISGYLFRLLLLGRERCFLFLPGSLVDNQKMLEKVKSIDGQDASQIKVFFQGLEFTGLLMRIDFLVRF